MMIAEIIMAEADNQKGGLARALWNGLRWADRGKHNMVTYYVDEGGRHPLEAGAEPAWLAEARADDFILEADLCAVVAAKLGAVSIFRNLLRHLGFRHVEIHNGAIIAHDSEDQTMVGSYAQRMYYLPDLAALGLGELRARFRCARAANRLAAGAW